MPKKTTCCYCVRNYRRVSVMGVYWHAFRVGGYDGGGTDHMVCRDQGVQGLEKYRHQSLRTIEGKIEAAKQELGALRESARVIRKTKSVAAIERTVQLMSHI